MTKKVSGTSSSSPSSDVFSTAKIRELLELMKEYDLSEIDLVQDDQQIRLARGGSQAPLFFPSPAQASVAPAIPASGAGSAGDATSPAAAVDGPHIKVISSPMVGTYYSKPKPTADDFIKVGSKVTPETVVCIVEAMKVFNEIPAEVSGTIVEVLVKNEEAVDFNRPLFKVDTRS